MRGKSFRLAASWPPLRVQFRPIRSLPLRSSSPPSLFFSEKKITLRSRPAAPPRTASTRPASPAGRARPRRRSRRRRSAPSRRRNRRPLPLPRPGGRRRRPRRSPGQCRLPGGRRHGVLRGQRRRGGQELRLQSLASTTLGGRRRGSVEELPSPTRQQRRRPSRSQRRQSAWS